VNEDAFDPDGGEDGWSGAEHVSSGVWCESDSARAAIGAAIERSVDQLVVEFPRAREGEDPEGVHQARVATRRLRSDLRTFAPLLDQDWRTETRAELKWLADALGAVRDADVLEIRLAAAVDDIAVDADAVAPLLSVLRAQEYEARRTLIGVIDDARTASLVDELRRCVADPPTTLAALGRADRRLRPLVRRPWRKFDRTVRALGDDPSASELHRVRLMAKRTRYAAEAVVPVFGRDARRFARAVKQVQDVLGDMNDADVAIGWLARTAPDLDPAAAYAAGQLAHHFRGVADAHRHGWERAYERTRKRSSWLT
jgi:CHAD domain-containing protein